ncbi:hypothetical protein HID58_041340 [Brassica napus]|uniref:Uncharacterized protein n=1 Tax=Brassica napus TaxID=3708 RepID=A0ABQ8BBK0_BRANA|nr:hypothetical protein HID58_041340 [Brassica napus]
MTDVHKLSSATTCLPSVLLSLFVFLSFSCNICRLKFELSIRSRQDSEEALTIFFCLGTLPFDISTFVAEPEIDAVGRLFGGEGRDARNREQVENSDTGLYNPLSSKGRT